MASGGLHDLGGLRIENMRCAHLRAPLAVDADRPRFTWQVAGEGFDRAQSAYQIHLSHLDGRELWDSGKVSSSDTLGILYAGRELEALSDYIWTLKVWDEKDRASDAATAYFSTGLRDKAWHAKWICVPPSKGAKPPEATLAFRNKFRALNVSNFRKEFELGAGVKTAKLYATALGAYRFFINGARVGDDYLTPGFTDYHSRVEYNAYDVTAQLAQGDNAISALLGEGWYSGFIGLDSKRPGGLWGRKPQLSAFLRIEMEDGARLEIITDQTWRHFVGGLIYSDMLKGEKFDARMYPKGWNRSGFDDSDWENAGTDAGASGLIVAAKSEPIRNTRTLTAQALTKAPDGAWIFDFGQNMVGFTRANFEAKKDQEVRFMHAEMLDADGDLYLENLRTANQETVYVAAYDGRATYAPTFTFHGFRYVGVYGLTTPPKLEDVVGVVINNDLTETAIFSSSSDLLNQLSANILWSQRGNFVSVPMDCPQRDERLGWTADGQVFAPTASYNMDINAFFDKWLDDIVDAQSDEGAFPDVAPRANSVNDGAPAWGDAGVIVPLLLFERYADKDILARMYQPMAKWMAFIKRHNPDLHRTNRNHNNYGDWLSIGQQTPNELVATAYFAWMAHLMVRAAEILGFEADAKNYRVLLNDISSVFQQHYVREDGTIGSGSQTSYLIALHVGLVPDHLVDAAVEHLVANIHAAGDKVQVGFLGVRHICPVLTAHGHAELAYKLATSEEFPSWGYSVVNGATTIWERWDGWTKEHGFQIPNMNSFNHYAYGSIGEWMFEWMAGIAPDNDAPGFKQFYLRPTPGDALSSCDVSFSSPSGLIKSKWQRVGGQINYEFLVPANTRATLELSVEEDTKFLVNGELVEVPVSHKFGGHRATMHVGSGAYNIRVGADAH